MSPHVLSLFQFLFDGIRQSKVEGSICLHLYKSPSSLEWPFMSVLNFLLRKKSDCVSDRQYFNFCISTKGDGQGLNSFKSEEISTQT
jgi:hypothetical protein